MNPSTIIALVKEAGKLAFEENLHRNDRFQEEPFVQKLQGLAETVHTAKVSM